jgi:DNA topoisomerase-1
MPSAPRFSACTRGRPPFGTVAATLELKVRQTILSRGSISTVFKLAARLTHSCDRRRGIHRERTDSGFRYRQADGRLVRDAATLARIRALAIPPAWEHVWICPTATGHLQATGRDSRGRKQYRYHPAFRVSKENEKYGHLAAFGLALPRIRRQVEGDLALPGLPREKVLAAVVKLLDQTHLRVGNPEYARSNHSYGLTTLRDRHVSFLGGACRIRFRGKSRVWHERVVTDNKLVRVIRTCHQLPGQDLFQFRGADGRRHRIGSADVNTYLRRAAGDRFTAKDFRTWAGTVIATGHLANRPVPAGKAALKRTITDVVAAVAAELGNTAAVCRKSYIHPRVYEMFAAGAIPANVTDRPGLSSEECRALELLMAGRDGPRLPRSRRAAGRVA